MGKFEQEPLLEAGRGAAAADMVTSKCQTFSDVPTYTISQKAVAALFYAVSSVAIMFVNKIVLSIYGFPSSILLAIWQLTVTSVVLLVLKKARKVGIGHQVIIYCAKQHVVIVWACSHLLVPLCSLSFFSPADNN